jgi:sugar phosphate isomerase/epimerase
MPVKLGGTIAGPYSNAAEFAVLLERSRFSAITSPVNYLAPAPEAREYLDAAKSLGVAIAEAGVWKNTIAPDENERCAAMDYAKGQLAFADTINAACCVNIVGSRGSRWDGAYADNYSERTYDLIIASIQEILDDIKPRHTFYTIEPMPWMVPDGPDEYLRLIQDVNRERFGVHMDFVNMISSAKRFLFAGDFIDECFEKLAPYIKSCHCKDILLEAPFTTMLRETAPGMGSLDFARILESVDRLLPRDIPWLLEHMQTFEEYEAAYAYIAGIAKRVNVEIR